MINSAYQLLNKGSLRTLSLVLAIVLTICFFFNINDFSTNLRTALAIQILFILWGMVILWIHGIGLNIRATIWKIVFFPLVGYVAAMLAVVLAWFS